MTGAQASSSGNFNFAAFEQAPSPPRKRSFSRIVIMIAVFAIGITVGLFAARTVNRNGPVTYATSVRKPAPVAATVTVKPTQEGRRAPVRGISPSELPYDGAPPPAELTQQPRQQTQETQIAVPAYDETAGAGLSSIESPTELEQGAEPITTPPKESSLADETPVTKKEAKAAGNLPSAAPAAKNEDDQVKAKPIGGEAKAVKKRRSITKTAKDREIDRIREQADKELKRKLELGQAGSRARKQQKLAGAMRESREVRVRRILSKCERISNIFRREQCKWRLCSGMWGKNGCPSYPKPVTSH